MNRMGNERAKKSEKKEEKSWILWSNTICRTFRSNWMSGGSCQHANTHIQNKRKTKHIRQTTTNWNEAKQNNKSQWLRISIDSFIGKSIIFFFLLLFSLVDALQLWFCLNSKPHPKKKRRKSFKRYSIRFNIVWSITKRFFGWNGCAFLPFSSFDWRRCVQFIFKETKYNVQWKKKKNNASVGHRTKNHPPLPL